MPEAVLASAWGALFIFVARIVDVSCDTLRVILAVRGRRGVAAGLGFFQALIWIFAVGAAIRHLDSWMHVLGYAGGFATGTFVGITIEHALAYGIAAVRVVSRVGGVEMAEALRERGYGVTEFAGHGRDGLVEIVDCVVHRSHLDDVYTIVERFDPDAFVTVQEPRLLRGGRLATREWMVPDLARRWGTRQRA